MPRKRKDQQTPVHAPGQAYGEGVDQLQAQAAIPLPQRSVVPPPAGSTSAPPPPAGAPVAGGNPIAAAIAAAEGTPPPQGGLTAPSVRPGEPVTAGLAMGAGPGPEALRGGSRARAGTVADTFLMLAELTGDDRYRRLSAVAAQQGA